MLEVQNLSMRFGGLLAVDQVSLDVQEHEIVAIIGPNGAGKTTVFNCMSGFYKPTGGKILFQGGEIQGKPDFKISRLGLVRTFQHVRLFSRMTVVENLLVAQHRRHTEYPELSGERAKVAGPRRLLAGPGGTDGYGEPGSRQPGLRPAAPS